MRFEKKELQQGKNQIFCFLQHLLKSHKKKGEIINRTELNSGGTSVDGECSDALDLPTTAETSNTDPAALETSLPTSDTCSLDMGVSLIDTSLGLEDLSTSGEPFGNPGIGAARFGDEAPKSEEQIAQEVAKRLTNPVTFEGNDGNTQVLITDELLDDLSLFSGDSDAAWFEIEKMIYDDSGNLKESVPLTEFHLCLLFVATIIHLGIGVGSLYISAKFISEISSVSHPNCMVGNAKRAIVATEWIPAAVASDGVADAFAEISSVAFLGERELLIRAFIQGGHIATVEEFIVLAAQNKLDVQTIRYGLKVFAERGMIVTTDGSFIAAEGIVTEAVVLSPETLATAMTDLAPSKAAQTAIAEFAETQTAEGLIFVVDEAASGMTASGVAASRVTASGVAASGAAGFSLRAILPRFLTAIARGLPLVLLYETTKYICEKDVEDDAQRERAYEVARIKAAFGNSEVFSEKTGHSYESVLADMISALGGGERAETLAHQMLLDIALGGSLEDLGGNYPQTSKAVSVLTQAMLDSIEEKDKDDGSHLLASKGVPQPAQL